MFRATFFKLNVNVLQVFLGTDVIKDDGKNYYTASAVYTNPKEGVSNDPLDLINLALIKV